MPIGNSTCSLSASVERQLASTIVVQQVDLSMNLLPNTIIKNLMGNVNKLFPRPVARVVRNSMRKVSFVSSNDLYPTALLDFENWEKAARLLAALLSYFPLLHIVDVRACGRSAIVPTRLEELNASKDRFSETIVAISERRSEGVKWE